MNNGVYQIRKIMEVVNCKHTGWVARDIQGENRFLCNECGERFVRHPRALRKTERFLGALEYVTDFRKGLTTFTEACEAAKFSAEELKEALIGLFASPHWENDGPVRTSDPEDIEKNLFPTRGMGTSELLEAWRGAWPDIRAMEIHPFEGSIDRKTMVILTFIDESKQRLTFDECEINANSNQLVGSKSPLKSFTHPIVRQNYPASTVGDIFKKEFF